MADDNEPSEIGKNDSRENISINAEHLYERVKDLYQNNRPLGRDIAKLIVELSDDAIEEFGTTNQEKKVELRHWKEQAELILPPSSVEELRKRAEGQALEKMYPRKLRLRRTLLWVIIFIISMAIGIPALHVLLRDKNPSPTANVPQINQPKESKPPLHPEELRFSLVGQDFKERSIIIKIAIINSGARSALVTDAYPIIYRDPKDAVRRYANGRIEILPTEFGFDRTGKTEGLPAIVKSGEILPLTIRSSFDSAKFYRWGDPLQEEGAGLKGRRRVRWGLHFTSMNSSGKVFETGYPVFDLDIAEGEGLSSISFEKKTFDLFEDQHH